MIPIKGTGGSPTPRRNSGKSSNQPSMIIFVFGSNLAGRHGRGAALSAVKHHGAIYGQGVGLQGNAYAIPTKDENLRILPLDIVKKHVEDFIQHAATAEAQGGDAVQYYVTEIGCGLARPAGQTYDERVADMKKLFTDAIAKHSSYINLPNVFLPKAFGGTRDVFTDKDGEEVTSADASVTSASTDPNLDSMVINNIEPENAVRIYHSDAEVVGATTPAIESIETVCSKCGFCGPHTIDGYCHNKETGPHVSQYGKRIPTMHMNDDLIYGEGDKVYFREDEYGNGTLTSAKLHTNSKGDLIQGLNLGEKQYRRDASQDEIDKAEGVHIRKFGCPCVKCTIGGIVEEDEEGTPTGATAADPLGYGDSFVSPRNNIFQKSVTDIFLELEKYHNSKGIKGIDPETADYMMRIENRHMIAHASIEYASPKEWMHSNSSKKYLHNGGFVTKSKAPKKQHFLDNIHHYEISENCDVAWCSEMHEIRTPVYAEKSEVDAPSCTPYHKMGWKLDTCSCTPREQPTTFYMNVVGGNPDKDGIVDEPITFYPERDPDSKIPARSITLLRTTFGPTTDYIPERETFDHYSYVIPTLASFVLGDTRLGLPYVPKGTKEELDAGDPRLVGTVKAPCRCVRDRDKMQCDCKYEDLQIDKGEWNSTHIMSNDPVKGKSSSLGEVERKKIWYHKWYMQSKLPTVQKLGFNICPEDDDKCDHFFCKKWYKKDNKLGPNYPKETTPWQRNFAKERGVILPDDYDYSQSFEILSYLFKTPPNVDTVNEKIALHVAQVAHMKEHTIPFSSFKICDDCSAIYTHQDENVDSETGKVSPVNDSIHIITGTQYAVPVPAKKFISAVKFDDTGRYIRNADLELAFVGSSKIMDWQMLPMTEIIRNTITSAKEAVGKRLVISSGGAKGVDTLAEKIAIELGVRTHIYSPDIQGWEDGVWSRELGRIERGYKTRNLMIAQHCCKLINLVGKAPKTPKIEKGRTIKVMCKFCNLPHYSSGGCFTAKKAFWLGKDAETIAV